MLAALLLTGAFGGLAAQQGGDLQVSRPDRWFVSSVVDQTTSEPTHRMLYLGRDGTVYVTILYPFTLLRVDATR